MGNLVVNSSTKLKENEIKAIFRKGRIVFDTNVLLNLYRVKVDTRIEVLNLMKKHASQLWLPYQVCWEYHNQREKQIDNITNVHFEQLEKSLRDVQTSFKTKTDLLPQYPSAEILELNTALEEALAPIYEKINAISKTDIGFSRNEDTIYAELQKLYEGKVGEDYTPHQLLEIFHLAKQRFEYKIAPGFGDLENKKNYDARRLYGDVILWLQTIGMSKENRVDVIFVTNDTEKKDWFKKKESGKRREPINCLLDEFYTETNGKRIIILTQEDFLYYMKKIDKDAISESTIQNVKEISAITAIERLIAQQKEFTEKIEIARNAYANLQIPSAAFSNLNHAIYDSIELLKNAGYVTTPAWQSAIDAMKKASQYAQPTIMEQMTKLK